MLFRSSAGGGQPKTHNVGERISWNLRSPVSAKINLVKLDNGEEYDIPGANAKLPAIGSTTPKSKGAKVIEVLTSDDRREKMQAVCSACHTDHMIEGFYRQFDALVVLYNDKFAKPVKAIMAELKKDGHLKPGPFNDKIEWTWWEIWHHEGRRARHGASMSGPDYTWWHGLYEVAKHTYFKFIPELKDLVGEEKAMTLLKKHFTHPGHKWYFEGMSPERIDEMRSAYEKRYGKGSLQ